MTTLSTRPVSQTCLCLAGLLLLGPSCDDGSLADASLESSAADLALGAVTSFEAESLTRTTSAVGSQVTSEASASGGKYVQFTGTPATGAWLQFAFSVAEAGTYDLKFLYKSGSPTESVGELA